MRKTISSARIHKYQPMTDKLLVVGATAHTFLKASGFNTGNSPIDNEHFSWVSKVLSNYGDKIELPTDHVVSSQNFASDNMNASLVKGNIPNGMVGFDIGIETSQHFSSLISAKNTGTTSWNGPMGLFEIGLFSNGTTNVAMALAYWRGSKTLIGGGDMLEAMKRAGVSETEVSHVSTGGGATLRFLAGNEMPRIDCIDSNLISIQFIISDCIMDHM